MVLAQDHPEFEYSRAGNRHHQHKNLSLVFRIRQTNSCQDTGHVKDSVSLEGKQAGSCRRAPKTAGFAPPWVGNIWTTCSQTPCRSHNIIQVARHHLGDSCCDQQVGAGQLTCVGNCLYGAAPGRGSQRPGPLKPPNVSPLCGFHSSLRSATAARRRLRRSWVVFNYTSTGQPSVRSAPPSSVSRWNTFF